MKVTVHHKRRKANVVIRIKDKFGLKRLVDLINVIVDSTMAQLVTIVCFT